MPGAAHTAQRSGASPPLLSFSDWEQEGPGSPAYAGCATSNWEQEGPDSPAYAGYATL
jgi:hypothetical protein